MFFVQPMVAKAILPSFGGSAAVWTGVMLFFQVGLVAGYGVAHLFRIARGWWLVGLYTALVLLGILGSQMDALLAVDPGEIPMLSLLKTLFVSVGFSFLLLGATTPVLQMLCYRLIGEEPYWLYGVSNIASFLALLAYPVFFEPMFVLPQQIMLWKVALIILGGALLTLILLNRARLGDYQSQSNVDQNVTSDDSKSKSTQWPLGWLLYPFMASVAFISFTSHLTIDVAPVPLLWVLPLSVYLLSFVLVFSRKPFYSERIIPGICLLVCCVQAFPYFGWGQGKAVYVIPISLISLFVICWFCHGRLVSIRPEPKYLTRFYLALSIGGALGGIFCGIIAPIIFSGHLEYPLVVLAVGVMAFHTTTLRAGGLFVSKADAFGSRLVKVVPLTLLGFILVFHVLWFFNLDEKILAKERNFYSSMRIRETDKTIDMISGRIVHGLQVKAPDGAYIPTAYFHHKSAVGRIFNDLNQRDSWKAGVMGLGVGTVAAYLREGDEMTFIEIDPKVVRLAEDHFDFMRKARGKVDVHVGDGRKHLDKIEESSLDVFMIDAFTGDSVPAHLLTKEAFHEFTKYLNPKGLLVFNISNDHLQLDRLMAGLASESGWSLVLVDSAGLKPYGNPNQYAIFSKPGTRVPEFKGKGRKVRGVDDVVSHVLWSDHYSNIFQVLKF